MDIDTCILFHFDTLKTFVTTTRSLGLDTRFVCSMQPVSSKARNLVGKIAISLNY